MKKRYNYRIYPNKIQREYLESIFSINRFVWNQFLAANIRYYKHSKKFHFFNEMSSILTECKNIEGYKWGRLNLSIRTIKCPDCLIEHDRDINAAKNMLINYLKTV